MDLQAKYFMEHGARKGASRKRPTSGPVDMEEIAILERFYNQLCLLVERQRVSDPCSIALLLSAKKLLEKGTTLVRTLLVGMVEELQSWAKSSGLRNYNPCTLPILTFVRKCVGVDETDLQRLLVDRGLAELVYGAEAEGVKEAVMAFPAPTPPLLHGGPPGSRSRGQRQHRASNGLESQGSSRASWVSRGSTVGLSHGVPRGSLLSRGGR